MSEDWPGSEASRDGVEIADVATGRALLDESLAVLETFVPEERLAHPVVGIDPEELPDLRDLSHQLGVAEPAEAYATWATAVDGEWVWIILSAYVTRPTACRFRVACEYGRYRPTFQAGRHRELLDRAASVGMIGVAFEPLQVERGVLATTALGLTFDGAELTGVLVEAERELVRRRDIV